MCGIYGLISSFSIDANLIKKKVEKISYRGPDDSGFFYDYSDNVNISLGHRRLKIIDYSNLNQQPLSSKCKNYTIIYNGEIFNYKSIKKELEQDYTFKTLGDTEVLLYSYIKWGNDCLKKIRGMFSFAIYDKINRQIFFARDSLGKKPFYYKFKNNNFEFCSEAGPLKEDFSNTIDPEGLNHYLSYGYIPDEYSLFENIKKLPMSSYGIYDFINDKIQIKKYSCFPILKKKNYSYNQSYLEEKIWSLFKNAVSKRLENSDSGVGIFLSGGLDSSLIVAAAEELNHKNNRTYSFTFEDVDYSEEEYSSYIANYYKTVHTNIKISKFKNEDISDILTKMSEPIADSSLIPFYLLSKNSVKFDKVILSGDGGDELFGGYDYYKKLTRTKNLLSFVPDSFLSKFSNLSKLLQPGTKGRNFINSLSHGKLNQSIISTSYFDQNLRKEIFNKDYLNTSSEKFRSPEDLRIVNSYDDLINKISNKDLEYTLSNSHLVKVDRASMLNSQEIRSPFLDEDLINFADNQIPSSLKVSFFSTRILQKKIGRNKLPSNFNFNRKQGFSIPLSNVINNEISNYLMACLDKNIFNFNFLEKMIKRKEKNYSRLYALYAFAKSIEA